MSLKPGALKTFICCVKTCVFEAWSLENLFFSHGKLMLWKPAEPVRVGDGLLPRLTQWLPRVGYGINKITLTLPAGGAASWHYDSCWIWKVRVFCFRGACQSRWCFASALRMLASAKCLIRMQKNPKTRITCGNLYMESLCVLLPRSLLE